MRAREALARRPLAATIAALAAAGRRWGDDPVLRTGLPGVTALSRPMCDAVLPLAAAALDAAVMTELVEATWGAGAASRPAPPGPRLVAHVLASNVPALGVPAIALGCLAGAAVVVKSGRADPLSAPAFVRALAGVDPALAATVVAAYWPGGAREPEAAALDGADVVVVTGGEAAVAAVGARRAVPVVAHGPRTSVVAVAGGGMAVDALAAAVARDVVLYDQRGCLSAHAVYLTRDAGIAPAAFAAALAAALDGLAAALPPGPVGIEARAAVAAARADAEWGGAAASAAGGAAVLREPAPAFRPPIGGRTVRVHAIDALADLPDLLPAGAIEAVAVTSAPSPALVAALRARGVSRVCSPGRLQEPQLTWPRGQRHPLPLPGCTAGEPRIEVAP